MRVIHCYETPEDKAAKFPTITIPSIFDMARVGRVSAGEWVLQHNLHMIEQGEIQLEALHELLRRGKYATPAGYNCDYPQSVAVTIAKGGDCDQWASVALAALYVLGYKARLVTFGDKQDRFQHVAVVALWDFKSYLLDAKGDQAGQAFNDWNNGYDVWETWTR